MILHQCGAPECSTLTATLTEFHAEVSAPGDTEATRVAVRACSAAHLHQAIGLALTGATARRAEIDAEEQADEAPPIVLTVTIETGAGQHLDEAETTLHPSSFDGSMRVLNFGHVSCPGDLVVRIRRTA